MCVYDEVKESIFPLCVGMNTVFGISYYFECEARCPFYLS